MWIFKLTSIRIEWNLLSNDHIIQITDSCAFIDSIFFTTNENVEDGLLYLINKVKQFKVFSIRVDSLKDE